MSSFFCPPRPFQIFHPAPHLSMRRLPISLVVAEEILCNSARVAFRSERAAWGAARTAGTAHRPRQIEIVTAATGEILIADSSEFVLLNIPAAPQSPGLPERQ